MGIKTARQTMLLSTGSSLLPCLGARAASDHSFASLAANGTVAVFERRGSVNDKALFVGSLARVACLQCSRLGRLHSALRVRRIHVLRLSHKTS